MKSSKQKFACYSSLSPSEAKELHKWATDLEFEVKVAEDPEDKDSYVIAYRRPDDDRWQDDGYRLPEISATAVEIAPLSKFSVHELIAILQFKSKKLP
jgi:hypothetical protein